MFGLFVTRIGVGPAVTGSGRPAATPKPRPTTTDDDSSNAHCPVVWP
jgi:hypothetical protein